MQYVFFNLSEEPLTAELAITAASMVRTSYQNSVGSTARHPLDIVKGVAPHWLSPARWERMGYTLTPDMVEDLNAAIDRFQNRLLPVEGPGKVLVTPHGGTIVGLEDVLRDLATVTVVLRALQPEPDEEMPSHSWVEVEDVHALDFTKIVFEAAAQGAQAFAPGTDWTPRMMNFLQHGYNLMAAKGVPVEVPEDPHWAGEEEERILHLPEGLPPLPMERRSMPFGFTAEQYLDVPADSDPDVAMIYHAVVSGAEEGLAHINREV